LQQFRPELSFPFCRCKDYSSQSQPYVLIGPTVSYPLAGIAEYTFTVHYKGTVLGAPPCYYQLEEGAYKLILNVCESWGSEACIEQGTV
jgi:hypothetical protein